jgi:hypothetical protein
METFYIGPLEHISQTRRKEGYFKRAYWNVYDRIMTDSPRTNNMVEAWHRVFQLEVSKHPIVLKLVTVFILEQSLTELFIEQLKAGDFYKQKRSEINKTEEMKAKCLKFDSNDLEDYLN